MKQLFDRIAVLWCRARHNRKDGRPNISRPINGKYTCWTCLRSYQIDGKEPAPGAYYNSEVVLG